MKAVIPECERHILDVFFWKCIAYYTDPASYREVQKLKNAPCYARSSVLRNIQSVNQTAIYPNFSVLSFWFARYVHRIELSRTRSKQTDVLGVVKACYGPAPFCAAS